jgi:hypothetical protein
VMPLTSASDSRMPYRAVRVRVAWAGVA